jgi:hypothetical protein
MHEPPHGEATRSPMLETLKEHLLDTLVFQILLVIWSLRPNIRSSFGSSAIGDGNPLCRIESRA